MPERCKCCTHPKRAEINDLILKRGESDGSIASQYGMSREAVRRHRTRHLSFSPQAASEAHNVATIVGFATDLHRRATAVLERAESMLSEGDGNSRSVQAAAASLREVRASIELLAKLIVSGDQGETAGTANAALDARIGEALAELALPALSPAPVLEIGEAEIVSDQ